MLKLFKNLFGSGSTETHTNGNGHVAPPPQQPVQVQARPVAARPVPQAAIPTATAPAPRPAPRPVGDGSAVQIPLYTIIAVLPLELKTRIRQTMVAEIFIMLPTQRVLEQLSTGSVKITFGELRQLAPNVFAVQADLDATEIPLPLNEILPQINPAMLPRRQAQRQLEVSDDIRGPFGNEGLGAVTIGDARASAPIAGTPAAPVQQAPAPAAPAPMIRPAPMQPVQPVRPAMPVQPPARPAMPAQPMMPAQAIKPAFPIPAAKPTPPAAQPPRPPMPGQPPRPPAAPIPPAPAAPAHAPLADAPLIQFRPPSITSTPTPRPPTAAPSVNPPVKPVLPPARGAGAVPGPTMVPRMPSNGGGNGNGNGHPAAPTIPGAPLIQMAPQAPQQAAPVAPAAPAAPEVCLPVPLAMVSESWPEAVRGEIEQLNLRQAQLALPVRLVEPALKQGRVAFPWNVVRSWIRPAALPTVSAHDNMTLEFPLHVIAPLFISRQKSAGRVQQKLKINEKIPNLFFGFPQPDSEPAPAPAAPVPMAPIPTAPAVPMPTVAPVQRVAEPAIPDIFAPKGAPAAAQPAPVPPTPVQPVQPVSAQEIPDVFTPKPDVYMPKAAAAPADTNFYVWGETGEAPLVDESEYKKSTSPGTDFLSRYATPNEVVSRAAALDGVAGALVALPDGLMVASKLSPDLNGDTLAAFLPHIFGKVNQCTKELRMGELNNLNFTVGNVPWKIFRVNAIFFAAFGIAGKPLPTAQLAALAGELDRKK
jgi:predicted regulator of Ras-like GTPase activity (Roadblock/LC7/MglB family)